MEKSTSPENIGKIITTLLSSRMSTGRYHNSKVGLGNNSDFNAKNHFSGLSRLNGKAVNLLARLNPDFWENLLNAQSGFGHTNSNLIDDNMKNYIKSFEQDPARHEALLDEFKKHILLISEKINRSIGKAPQQETMDAAHKTLDSEIKKCRQIIHAKIEKEKIVLSTANHRKGIEYKGHDVPATVNGRNTGMSVKLYEMVNLDQAHSKMHKYYIDMSKAKFTSLDTAVNMGNITPAALLAILIERSTKNDYVLASKLGVTDLLKERSLAKFNQDKPGLERITQTINTKLTDYLNLKNGYTQTVGQDIRQNITQQQGMNVGL